MFSRELDVFPEPLCRPPLVRETQIWRRKTMDGLIYLIGLIVIIMAILSFFGLR
jgi:hypothetical protein